MRKFLRILVAFMLVIVLPATIHAQEKTITGTIRSDDNRTPLSGVTIRVKGTNRVTQTDANGNFSIKASPGETLLISYVGFEEQQVKAGDGNAISVNLKSTTGTLGEVVVTAMDIKRNSRELGYSVQKVSGAEIAETQRENFLNSLQGRVAGLTITSTSGLAGSSSSIVLRGFNSLAMSNQPLFVIDGIVMDNSTIDENSAGGSGVGMVERTGLTSTSNRNTDYNNRISDINPSDIESITILKGPEATALYGSQASSGAIVITTRKAKSNKFALQYDNSFRASELTRFPEVYDQYKNGTNGFAASSFRYFGQPYQPTDKKFDNIGNFFRTGFSQTHNIGADFGLKNSIFRVSGSYFDQDGIVPNNWYKRYTARISNTTKIGKFMDISPTFTYSDVKNNKILGSAGGFMLGLLVWPNFDDIRVFTDPNGLKEGLFSANPNADFDSPLFNVENNKNYDQTSRYIASLGININPTDWLTISGRFGYEHYFTEGYTQYHPQSYFIAAAQKGLQDNYYRKYDAYNHTITATARKSLGNWNFRLMGGTMWQDYQTGAFVVTGNQLADPNRTDSSNTLPSSRTRLLRNYFGEYNISELKQFAYFGEFAVNYKNIAFLNYTHRFETASTLPKQNREYNYPGASLSLILSDIFPGLKKGDKISYVKLRGSIAGTARLNSPYSTQSTFTNTLSSGGGYNYGFTRANPFLEPEKQRTYEVGTEWRLFNSRFNVEVSYYNTLNTDQIVDGNFRLSYATGFVLNALNVGSTRNQGVEISVNTTVAKSNTFRWDMAFNFNRMWNKVLILPDNVPEYYIADTWLFQNARAGIMKGFPTTTITSYGYTRNNAGQILIDPTNGLPVLDQNFRIHGDRNPDFTLGWNNNLSLKNWRLSFLWDLKVGGDVFNATKMFMTSAGRSPVTADRFEPRVIDGVLKDGRENSSNPTKNTIIVVPAYNDAYYTYTYMPEEAYIEKDVNWFRLRDITLSYSFSNINKFIRGLKNLGVFFTANDLVLMTNYTGADPNSNGNTASSRGVGSFGFDYGKIAAPVSLNFGLKAGF